MNAKHGTLLAIFLIFGPSIRAEWISLFNGRDLTGWHQLNGQAKYAVVDEAIVGTPVPDSPNSFLATDGIYGDFVFECEVRVDGAINSGIQFRSLSSRDFREGRVHGYQYELDPRPERRWTGGIYDEARRGWLYPLDLNPPAKTAYQHGSWNHIRIECVGSSLRTWVNGIPASHLIDEMTAEGFIALQVHGIGSSDPAGRQIRWRNLRIRTDIVEPTPNPGFFIRNTTPNGLAPAEAAQGWRLLWDGRTPKGWRAANGDAFPDDGWTLEEGELTTLGTEYIDLVTVDRFSAFEVQLDFMVGPGGNSGIKYFVKESTGEAHQGIGLEYQIIDDTGNPDAGSGVSGNRTCASLYDLIPARRNVSGQRIEPKPGVWHHARIVVRPDKTTEHWIDGFKVVEYTRGSSLYESLIARSKYAGIDGFASVEQTPILLQDHGHRVAFRSLKVRDLN